MAGNMIANTFTTPDAKNLREDLGSIIFNVSPADVPFVSSIAKNKASGTFHEWNSDVLAPFDVTNAQVQGDDIASFPAVVPTKRLGNRTQISRKVAIISGTLEVADKAGMKSQVSYTIAKLGKELKKDIEGILLNNQAAVPASSGVAPTLAGVPSWLVTNTDFGAGGADATGDGSNARTDGTQRALTEAQWKGVLTDIYDVSGEQPDMMLVPPGKKSSVSAFPGNATRFIDATSKEIVSGVNLYSGDFGELKIVPCRQMRTREILAVSTDMWALSWYRPIKMVDLAVTGDAQKRMLVCEYTLESRNELASGGVFDLS